MSRRIAAASLALLAFAATACGSRVRDWPDDAAFSTTETTRQRVASDGDETVPDSTTTLPTGGTTATTKGSSSAVKPAADDLPAPAPGKYTYDVTDEIPAFEDEPASTEKSVATVTWRVTRTPSQVTSETVESEGSEASRTAKFLTTASAFSLVSTTNRDGEDIDECAYRPALLLLQLPLRVGATWRGAASCDHGDVYKESVTADSRVVGEATDTIGGQRVPTIVVTTLLTFTETYEPDPDDPEDTGTDTFKVEITSHYEPTTLLPVIEETKSVDDDGFSSRRQLRSLKPA